MTIVTEIVTEIATAIMIMIINTTMSEVTAAIGDDGIRQRPAS